MTNIAIVGGRDFNDYELMKQTIFDYLKCPHCNVIHTDTYYAGHKIVSGGAKGADSLAEKIAEEYGFETIVHKPDWNKYGKSAGYIRNTYIIADADIVFAFWDGKSKGTEHSINIARKMDKTVRIINYGQN